jgi:hypothetical protein
MYSAPELRHPLGVFLTAAQVKRRPGIGHFTPARDGVSLTCMPSDGQPAVVVTLMTSAVMNRVWVATFAASVVVSAIVYRCTSLRPRQ